MSGRPRSVRVRLGIVLAFSMMGATWTGCGDGDFVPPPPPAGTGGAAGSGEPAATTGGSSIVADPFSKVTTIRRIDLILSTLVAPEEASMEEVAARTQAGLDRARLHIWTKDDDGAPSSSAAREKTQADRVRASFSGKPQAIIVDPDDPADKELARAVQEARAARVPVVVIGRPIAGVPEAKAPGAAPMIVVAPQSFAPSARRIVELSIRNVKNSNLDPARGAIILFPTAGDRLATERAAAIREALAAAGITAVAELRIPRDMTAGSAILKERLQADPKPVMVFFLDLSSSSISKDAFTEVGEKRPFVQAGYTVDDTRTRLVAAGDYAAVGEYDPNRLIRKAVAVAVAAAQGRETKEREDIVVGLLESPARATLPHIPPKKPDVSDPARLIPGKAD